jgi:hypothetical protein
VSATEGRQSFSRYNALVRELISFEHALDHRLARLLKSCPLSVVRDPLSGALALRAAALFHRPQTTPD